MKVEHLRSFLAVYEEASFTAAAKRLYTVQPVVTRHLVSLEEELGTQLFTRTTRKVEPTAAGIALYSKVKDSLELLDQGIIATKTLSDHQPVELRIGYNYLYMDTLTTEWLKEYREELTKPLEIIITEADPAILLRQVGEGLIDGAFVGTTDVRIIPRLLNKILVGTTDEKIMVGQHHRLANREHVSVQDIIHEVFVYPFREPTSVSSPVKKDLEELNIDVDTRNTEFEGSALKIVELGEAIIDLPSISPIENANLVAIPYESKYRIDYYFIWNPENRKQALYDLKESIKSKSS